MDARTHELRDRLRAIAEPTVERLGLELTAVEVYGGKTRRALVRLSVDRVGGVGIGDCARVSRAISPLLDVEDVIASSYDLEVSSPGTEPPLQREKDFRKYAGCQVRVRLFGMDSRKWIKGTLGRVADGQVTVQTVEGPREFFVADVDRANVELTAEQFARMGEGLPPIQEGETP